MSQLGRDDSVGQEGEFAMSSEPSSVPAAPGAIYRMLAADHARLDRLLDRATAATGRIDPASYDGFRRGLLKHIAMEEKILLPAAQRLNGGEPLAIAARCGSIMAPLRRCWYPVRHRVLLRR
jgi:hypothetical protein